MSKQLTTPVDPGSDRKWTPRLVIVVSALLLVAACLCVAVLADPFGSGGSKSAEGDDIGAVTGASPSPVWDTGPVTAGVDSSPSKTAGATPSKTAAVPSNAAAVPSNAAAATPSNAAAATPSNAATTSSKTAAATPSPVASAAPSEPATSAGGSSSSSDSGGGSSSGTKPAKRTKLTCTLSIDAETAGVGTILAARTVRFKAGETVFDVLQREGRAAGIPMEFEHTPMYKSAYIEGINGLYEFDRGELSGWMYSVNDWFPNYGCSRYKLKGGDVVRWRYTCDLGRDIGGYVATGE